MKRVVLRSIISLIIVGLLIVLSEINFHAWGIQKVDPVQPSCKCTGTTGCGKYADEDSCSLGSCNWECTGGGGSEPPNPGDPGSGGDPGGEDDPGSENAPKQVTGKSNCVSTRVGDPSNPGGNTDGVYPTYSPSTNNITPNKNNCGGHYTLNNPIGNFGDPGCELLSNEEMIREEFEKYESEKDYIDEWMYLVECESQFNTNAYKYEEDDQGNPKPVFGLLQMDSHETTPRIYKTGDVHWKIQIYNAIWYANWYEAGGYGSRWSYWSCAYDERGNIIF